MGFIHLMDYISLLVQKTPYYSLILFFFNNRKHQWKSEYFAVVDVTGEVLTEKKKNERLIESRPDSPKT